MSSFGFIYHFGFKKKKKSLKHIFNLEKVNPKRSNALWYSHLRNDENETVLTSLAFTLLITKFLKVSNFFKHDWFQKEN